MTKQAELEKLADKAFKKGDFSNAINVILKNLLELSSCIRILGSLYENLAFNLDFLANKIKEEDLPDFENLYDIWKALLRIIVRGDAGVFSNRNGLPLSKIQRQ